MGDVTLVRGQVPALERELAARLAGARAADPLAPVTVLVGHVLLKRYLPRMLARDHGLALINVNFVQAHELADALAPPDASVRTRIAMPADRLLARHVAASAGGYFSTVRGREGFAGALYRLFRELEGAALDAAAFELAVDGAISADRSLNADKLHALAALYRAWCDGRSTFDSSASKYAAADASRFAGAFFAYGMTAPTELQARLIEAVLRAAGGVVFAPDAQGPAAAALAGFIARLQAAGADEVTLPAGSPDASPASVAARVFGPAGDGRDALPAPAIALISAPDTVREVWEAARACLAWSREGVPLHDIAVVYRNSDPYRALVDEIFSAAGIETYLHDGRILAAHPLGRRLLALLALAERLTFARAEVMDFVTETRVSDVLYESFDRYRPSEWEALTRDAGILQGFEQWEARLRRLAAEKLERAKDERRTREAQDVARIDELRRFAGAFYAALESRLGVATWEEHLAWVRDIAATYAQGTEPIIEALADLRALAIVEPRPSFAVFLQAVRDDLSRRDASIPLGEPIRAFGRRGVAVLDATSAGHLGFRAVCMLGMAERAWPPPLRPDPLLLEHERAAVAASAGSALPLRTEPDREPLAFSLALQAARERAVISFARADAGASGRHLPSYFFRATVEALEGRRVTIDELDATRWVRRIAASRLAADTPAAALTEAEYDRGLIHAAVRDGDPAPVDVLRRSTPSFARAIIARAARWSTDLTAYDGVMVSDEALEAAAGRAGADQANVMSPSRVETYATCPYRSFLQTTLGIAPVEEPEALDRIDARERGSLVHAILERFLTRIGRADPPSAARREAHLAVLREVTEKECRERVERGVTGKELFWEIDRRQIEDDLVQWYDVEVRDADGLLPGACEARFGAMPQANATPGATLSRGEPLTVVAGGRAFRFRGSIDRIDWDDARTRFRVIDYKTGKSYPPNQVLKQGQRMQLPLYLLAAADLLRIPPEQGEAQYFFLTTRGGFKRVRMTGDEFAQRRGDVEQVLATVADGMASGMFAPAPGDACTFCDFKQVCDVAIKPIMELKADSPRRAAYVALKDIS